MTPTSNQVTKDPFVPLHMKNSHFSQRGSGVFADFSGAVAGFFGVFSGLRCDNGGEGGVGVGISAVGYAFLTNFDRFGVFEFFA